MATLTVTKLGQSQKGRTIVYFDNRHGYADGFLLGDNCGMPPLVGQVIEPDTSSSEWPKGSGKHTWWLNGYKAMGAVDLPGKPEAVNPVIPRASIDESHLRFISNVVGQAISAKTITQPSEIASWAKAAQDALNNLDVGF
jgi:hypothetical protein